MKKLSIAAILGISILNADFLSFSTGGGIWSQDVDGYVKLDGSKNYFDNKAAEKDGDPNTGNFGLKTKKNFQVWFKFIHPVPMLPNVKFQYTKYDSTGHSDYIAGNIKIGDYKLNTALTNADTTQTIDSFDLTLFYEFKPVFVDIEAGLGLDLWKGHTVIKGSAKSVLGTEPKKTWVDEKWTSPLPYLYAHLESMSLFGFSVLGDLKWIKAGDSHHYDYNGAVKFTLDIFGPVNPFIKVGYRYKEAQGKDGDNITVIKYKGAYAEIGAKF